LLDEPNRAVEMERTRVDREGVQSHALDLRMMLRPGDQRFQQTATNALLALSGRNVHRQLSSMRQAFSRSWLEVDEAHHIAINLRHQHHLRRMSGVLANPGLLFFRRETELLQLANVVCALGDRLRGDGVNRKRVRWLSGADVDQPPCSG